MVDGALAILGLRSRTSGDQGVNFVSRTRRSSLSSALERIAACASRSGRARASFAAEAEAVSSPRTVSGRSRGAERRRAPSVRAGAERRRAVSSSLSSPEGVRALKAAIIERFIEAEDYPLKKRIAERGRWIPSSSMRCGEGETRLRDAEHAAALGAATSRCWRQVALEEEVGKATTGLDSRSSIGAARASTRSRHPSRSKRYLTTNRCERRLPRRRGRSPSPAADVTRLAATAVQ